MNTKQQLEFTKQIVNSYFHLLRVKRDASKGDVSYINGRIDSIELILRKIGIEPYGTEIN